MGSLGWVLGKELVIPMCKSHAQGQHDRDLILKLHITHRIVAASRARLDAPSATAIMCRLSLKHGK